MRRRGGNKAQTARFVPKAHTSLLPFFFLAPAQASTFHFEGTKCSTKGVSLDLGGVGVRAQALAAHAGDNVYEASVVLHALLRPGSNENSIGRVGMTT